MKLRLLAILFLAIATVLQDVLPRLGVTGTLAGPAVSVTAGKHP